MSRLRNPQIRQIRNNPVVKPSKTMNIALHLCSMHLYIQTNDFRPKCNWCIWKIYWHHFPLPSLKFKTSNKNKVIQKVILWYTTAKKTHSKTNIFTRHYPNVNAINDLSPNHVPLQNMEKHKYVTENLLHSKLLLQLYFKRFCINLKASLSINRQL